MMFEEKLKAIEEEMLGKASPFDDITVIKITDVIWLIQQIKRQDEIIDKFMGANSALKIEILKLRSQDE